ncbi:MAG: hypothetical protein K0R38_2623 [Polyangiaceae bacterium]|jgi:hypothetical protein|nr:hypothetical protein [Polyangiaceae bacterium]
MASERRVAICVYRGFIEPACERGLRSLETQGWEVWRRAGSAAIDRERSLLATEALDAGFDALLWVDSDQVFDAAAAQTLDELDEPFVSALIARRGGRDFACVFAEGTREVVLGEGGGPLEVRYVGCGFCLVRRSAFELIVRHFGLPRVVDPSGAIVPFYLPMVTAVADRGLAYLGEDYAFCERLRQAGGRVLVDTRLRIGHLGSYEYVFEDVVQPVRTQAASLRVRTGAKA